MESFGIFEGCQHIVRQHLELNDDAIASGNGNEIAVIRGQQIDKPVSGEFPQTLADAVARHPRQSFELDVALGLLARNQAEQLDVLRGKDFGEVLG